MTKRHKPEVLHNRAREFRRDMTEAEKALWLILRSRRLNDVRFRRQVPIGTYIADFCSHEARLIIEVDGGQHDATLDTENSRTRFLKSAGYRVLRIWNNDILANPDGVFAVIAEALRQDHPHPNPPPSRGRA